LKAEQRFAGASRAEDEGARATVNPATKKRVQLDIAAGKDDSRTSAKMFLRDESGKDFDAAGLDYEIVVTAADAWPRYFTTRMRRLSAP
jgi:hypothetical protein